MVYIKSLFLFKDFFSPFQYTLVVYIKISFIYTHCSYTRISFHTLFIYKKSFHTLYIQKLFSQMAYIQKIIFFSLYTDMTFFSQRLFLSLFFALLRSLFVCFIFRMTLLNENSTWFQNFNKYYRQ